MSENTLLFNISSFHDTGPHSLCVARHCIKKGNPDGACISTQLAQFLNNQDSGRQAITGVAIPANASDWYLLDGALKSPKEDKSKKILEHFSLRKASYGLRYNSHRLDAMDYVNTLFDRFSSINDENPILGKKLTALDILNYKAIFKILCNQCQHSSNGEIYRLFDIRGNPPKYTYKEWLSLLFAMGHSNSSSAQKVQTLSQFVARFEFFKWFVDESEVENAKKSRLSEADFLKDIKSEKTSDFVNNLWTAYLVVTSHFFTLDSQSLLNHPIYCKLLEHRGDSKPQLSVDAHQLMQLRSAFSKGIYLKSRSDIQKFPINFKSSVEASYHPFKHGEVTHTFFRRKNVNIWDFKLVTESDFLAYARNSMRDYLEMIHQIIGQGVLVKIQPDQFTSALIFQFSIERVSTITGEHRIYSTYLKCYQNGISYVLTCFDRKVSKLELRERQSPNHASKIGHVPVNVHEQLRHFCVDSPIL
ncbi:MAG: hypothetical protein LLG04_13425 [Parachlamydia sp.]|nr:hypothetical protein [Parachlamydia sp.]